MGDASATALLAEQVKSLHELRRYREIIAILEDDPRVATEPELALVLASSLGCLFEHDRAREVLEAVREATFASTDAFVIRRWQVIYAVKLINSGDLEEGKQLLRECLASAEQAQHARLVSNAALNLGIIASLEGELVEAMQLNMRSIAAAQALGEAYMVGRAHYNTGLVLREWGRHEAASKHLSLAEEYFSTDGTPEERVLIETERAVIYMELGDLELAERLARSAVLRAQRLHNNLLEAGSLKALGTVVFRRRGPDIGRPILIAALEAGTKTSSSIFRAEVFEELAMLELSADRIGDAGAYKEKALSHYRRMNMNKHVGRFVARFVEASWKEDLETRR